MNRVPMTVQGEQALREELERLKRVDRAGFTAPGGVFVKQPLYVVSATYRPPRTGGAAGEGGRFLAPPTTLQYGNRDAYIRALHGVTGAGRAAGGPSSDRCEGRGYPAEQTNISLRPLLLPFSTYRTRGHTVFYKLQEYRWHDGRQ